MTTIETTEHLRAYAAEQIADLPEEKTERAEAIDAYLAEHPELVVGGTVAS